MIIARAPYRVSFLGGGTDFPAWYNEHGGAVLSATINKYCYILARWLPPFFEHKYRIVWSQIELPNYVDDIIHPKVREVLKFLGITDGVEIHHAGDLPARTGMGTSSSFTVALLKALITLKGQDASKEQLTKIAIHIEQNICKEYVGSQDQTAAAYGGFNRIDFSCKGVEVTPLEYNEELDDRLMLFFTGFQRNAVDIEKEKFSKLTDNRQAFEVLYKLVGEGQVVLDRGELNYFGELLDVGWRAKRAMAHNTSTDYIDFLYQKGLDAGAVGGKLLGAGGGGFLLFHVEPEQQSAVKEAMKGLLQVPFKFENEGAKVIFDNGERKHKGS